ncbi:MAG: hypothetical protein AMXMBFR44_6890 [Candidatus Campbellbacteria bacterium]
MLKSEDRRRYFQRFTDKLAEKKRAAEEAEREKYSKEHDEFLRGTGREGKITYRTRWRDVEEMFKDEECYKKVRVCVCMCVCVRVCVCVCECFAFDIST